MDLKRVFVLTLFLGIFCPAFCCGDTLHCRLYFPVGSSTPDLSYRDNGVRLDSLLSGIRSRQAHSVLRRISMRSGACPMNGSRPCGALSWNAFPSPIRYSHAPLRGMTGRGLPHLSRLPTCPTARRPSVSFVILPSG